MEESLCLNTMKKIYQNLRTKIINDQKYWISMKNEYLEKDQKQTQLLKNTKRNIYKEGISQYLISKKSTRI